MLKCPYCPETRPSRSRLDNHITQQHGPTLAAAESAHGPELQAAAEIGNRTMVALVNEDDGTQCRSTVPAGFGQTHRCPQTAGHDGDHGDPNGSPRWPDRYEPTPKDREDLQTAWDRVGEGLDKAGQEMREMRAVLDAVDERMRKLDAELTKPSVVRRATLNQVWDRLLDAGHLAAAREVMKMIERVVD